MNISKNDQRRTPAAGRLRLLVSLCATVALGGLVSAPAAPAAKTKKWEIAIGGGSETHVQRADTDGFCSEYQTRKEDQEVDFRTPPKEPLVAKGPKPGGIGALGGVKGKITRSVSEDPCGPPEGEFAPPAQSDCGTRPAKGNMAAGYVKQGTIIGVDDDGLPFATASDGLMMQGGVEAQQPFRACSVSPQHAVGNYFVATPGLGKLEKGDRKRFESKLRESSCKEDAADSTVTSCRFSNDIVVEVTRVK